MKYEEFVCLIQTNLSQRLGEEVRVQRQQVTKNNSVVLDGLSFHEADNPVAPTIYLNEFYAEYQKGKGITEITEYLLELYRNNRISGGFCPEDYTEFEKIRRNLACKLINREKNEELLKRVPHKDFLDLAIVVYCRIRDEFVGNGTILVTHQHCRVWGRTEEEVLDFARENMKAILPVSFANIAEMLGFEEEEDEVPMYVITNQENYLGASYIIYDSVLQEIGEKLGCSFWILPSSIHECIIVPETVKMSAEELQTLVQEVNEQEVLPEDYLSGEVYFYDLQMHRLSEACTKLLDSDIEI